MDQVNYYQSRINKALSYIEGHLGEDINVQKLAEISNFSMYHFQRIFKALKGESPYESLLRLRLEKAVFLLKYRSKMRIKDIAFDCGFPSPENFTRQFKSRFKISPSTFKKDKELQNSRIYQEHHPDDFYISIDESRKLPLPTFEARVERIPDIDIVFVKAVFGADGSGLVEQYLGLIEWAKKYNVRYTGELTRFGMSIDNPEVTPASKYRYDFALKADHSIPLEGNLEYGMIPGGEYVTVHAVGKLEVVAQAWDYIYKYWLPESGYVPLHYPAIEEFIIGPEDIGWDNFNLKCRVPIIKEE